MHWETYVVEFSSMRRVHFLPNGSNFDHFNLCIHFTKLRQFWWYDILDGCLQCRHFNEGVFLIQRSIKIHREAMSQNQRNWNMTWRPKFQKHRPECNQWPLNWILPQMDGSVCQISSNENDLQFPNQWQKPSILQLKSNGLIHFNFI